MIYRKREPRTKLTVLVKTDVLKKIEQYVDTNNYYKSDVIDQALENYVEKLEAENE